MKRILFVNYFIFCCVICNCQIYSNDTTYLPLFFDDIFLNIKDLNEKERFTEIREIKGIYKLSVWHFAPSVSYDFIRQSYYLNISSSHLVSHFIGKRQENRRIGTINRKYNTKNNSDEIKLRNQILSIQADYQDLLLSHQVIKIEVEAFLINKEQFEKNEINTESFLNSKSNIINKIKNFNSDVTTLYNKLLTLSDLSLIEFDEVENKIQQLRFNLNFLE